MKETIIIEKKKVEMNKHILLVGLPGIGLIGQVLCKYMVDELGGKFIAELYSPHFPHQVLMTKRGRLRMIKNKFYSIKTKKRDFLVLLGDVQAPTSEAQYEIAGMVLDFCEKNKVNEIITIGGYRTGKLKKKKRIFGSSNNKRSIELFKKRGVIFGKSKGAIVGIAGLLPALAGLRKIPGVCLMGETHGDYVDIDSAESILSMLSEYLGFEIDLKKMRKEAKVREKIIKKIEEEIKKEMVLPQKTKDISYIR